MIEWAFFQLDGKRIPMTPKIPIAPYSVLSVAARQNVSPNYAKEVLFYLSRGSIIMPAPFNLVYDEFNAFFRPSDIFYYVDTQR